MRHSLVVRTWQTTRRLAAAHSSKSKVKVDMPSFSSSQQNILNARCSFDALIGCRGIYTSSGSHNNSNYNSNNSNHNQNDGNHTHNSNSTSTNYSKYHHNCSIKNRDIIVGWRGIRNFTTDSSTKPSNNNTSVVKDAKSRTNVDKTAEAVAAVKKRMEPPAPGPSVKLVFIENKENGQRIVVDAEIGKSVLDSALKHNVDIEAACGGEMACSTCHTILTEELFNRLPKKSEEEQDMLDLAWGLEKTSRLCCQIKVTADMAGAEFRIPAESNSMM